MEEFFYLCSQVDEVELYDLVMKNYPDMQFCMQLSVDVFLELCVKLLNNRIEVQIREQWLALFPLMAIKWLEYESYEAYKDRLTGKNIDLRSNEEIIAEIEALHNKKEDK